MSPRTSTHPQLSPAEAAQHANVSVKTIRRWIANGDLRAYRLNRRLVRIDVAELDALLAPIPTTGGDAA